MSFLSGCASNPPLPTPDYVNLDRFMGTWFVIGYTPILVDKEAHNAVEHYFPAENGRIETTYQFRKGGPDGELKTFTPVGWIYNKETNAEWRMQFVWPFKAAYIILHVSEDYQRTIIAHPNRKYAWIMQREPQMSDSLYQAMLTRLEEVGFDPSVMQRVPQEWNFEPKRLELLRDIGTSKPLSEAALPN